MKILQLIQKPQLRGAEMFASQLSNHLLEVGHEVHMMSLLAGDATLPFTGKFIQLKRPLRKRLFDIKGWKVLSQYIQEFKPDVIQANAGDTLKFAVLSKLFFEWKAPIIFRNANKVSDFVTTTPKRLFNKFLMTQVHHVISVSELCRQDFLHTYSYSDANTTTVPIGINLNPIDTTLPSDLVSIFKSTKVLVNVASFVPEKNHVGLLRILQTLVSRGADIKLVLIGDGKLREVIEQQIKNMNLEDRVFLLGYRKDVLSIMCKAQAFVLPSIIEGLPGVILEAMYCHIPVVAYNVGGISEVVRDNETGWLVKAGDEEGFAKAIQEVFSMSPDELQKVNKKAYEIVVGEYDNKIIAKRFSEVYQKVSGSIFHE